MATETAECACLHPHNQRNRGVLAMLIPVLLLVVAWGLPMEKEKPVYASMLVQTTADNLTVPPVIGMDLPTSTASTIPTHPSVDDEGSDHEDAPSPQPTSAPNANHGGEEEEEETSNQEGFRGQREQEAIGTEWDDPNEFYTPTANPTAAPVKQASSSAADEHHVRYSLGVLVIMAGMLVLG